MKDLFYLIKSLKPNEKRYFTLTSNIMTPAKRTNYLKLFAAIDGMDDYNEEVLIKKYRNESFTKNLAAYKNHLYEFLMEALRNYNEENIEEWIIRKSFLKIQLLYSKGLDKSCEQLMIKTKEKAWQYEQYQVLLDILELQLYMFGNCRIGNFNQDYFDQLHEEKEKIMALLIGYNYVLANWHRLNLIFINKLQHSFEEVKTMAAKIISEEDMQKEVSTASLTLRNRYLACFELYYNSIGNAELCYVYNKKLIENRKLIDEKMPNFSTDPMAVFFNFMIACFKYEKWVEMEEYLEKTKNFEVSFIQQEIRRAHNTAYCGILLYLATRDYEKAKIISEDFLAAKTKFEGRYRIDFLIFTMSHVAWYYFINKQYDIAHNLWREIIQGPKYTVETRSQATTRFYLLIYYYTFNEFTLLESEITNTKRYLKQNFLLNDNENIFLTNFAKLNGSKSDTEVFRSMLSSLKGSEQILNEKSVFNRFIKDWIGEMVK